MSSKSPSQKQKPRRMQRNRRRDCEIGEPARTGSQKRRQEALKQKNSAERRKQKRKTPASSGCLFSCSDEAEIRPTASRGTRHASNKLRIFTAGQKPQLRRPEAIRLHSRGRSLRLGWLPASIRPASIEVENQARPAAPVPVVPTIIIPATTAAMIASATVITAAAVSAAMILAMPAAMIATAPMAATVPAMIRRLGDAGHAKKGRD